MRYLSVCSGIEAASVAWHDFGWTPVGFSEIDAFPSAVLAHRFPHVPNLGDMTKYKEWPLEPGSIDILVGGTPCQSFSVAGLRKGLEDPRGSLMLTYLAIAEHFRIPTLLWENVPGVLSSNGGRDFGAFLGALGELGYRWAYRVLDAQYFGVPQRRRRVFVIASASDRIDPESVLFEPESLRGDPAPRRKARKGSAAALGAGVDERGLQRTVGTLCADTHPGAYSGQDAYTGRLVPHINGSHWDDPTAPHPTLNRGGMGQIGYSNQEIFSQRGGGLVPSQPVVCATGATAHPSQAIPIISDAARSESAARTPSPDAEGRVRLRDPGLGIGAAGDPMFTLTATAPHAVAQPVAFAQNQVGEIRTNPVMGTLNTNSNATGRNTPLVMAPASHPVAFNVYPTSGQGAEPQACPTDIANAVTVTEHAKSTDRGTRIVQQSPMVVRRLTPCSPPHTLSRTGGVSHGSDTETRSREVLRLVLEEIGAEAFFEWGTGVAASFLPQEILQRDLHGCSVRCQTTAESVLGSLSLPRSENGSAGAVQCLWKIGRAGCSPSGRQSHEQRTNQLAAYLSELSRSRTPWQEALSDMRQTITEARVLRDALSEVQEMGRSSTGQGQPVCAAAAGVRTHAEAYLRVSSMFAAASFERVLQHARTASSAGNTQLVCRRLTPVEAERLQGFSDDWTNIPYRGKPAADGPRYKALGNSMAVPVMRWIGQRIRNA
jgi:site-specific DNA-cytosine methylase